jgi:TatD DNase family protein
VCLCILKFTFLFPVETDAPFMSPAPHRGKKCHSGLAWHTAKKICELKGVSVEEGFVQLRENARSMYGV